MEVVINSSNAILLWMNEFLKHVNDLSNAFDRNEINYHNIVIKCAIINNSGMMFYLLNVCVIIFCF